MSIFRKLRSLGRPKHPVWPQFDAPLRPDVAFYAIGDIHGQARQLNDAIGGIKAMAAAPTIICVGDYIDRGEQSAEVLRRLQDLTGAADMSVICLMGNHEQMCLRFLDEPEKHGERWLRYGGLQTLASFRVGHDPNRNMTGMRDSLAEAMGEDLISWLRALPLFWITGNVAVTHAGADPGHPISAQSARSLLWGHPDFTTVPRGDGMWVLHGHTIVDQPRFMPGVISIDTGAYAGGPLSVASVSAETLVFSGF